MTKLNRTQGKKLSVGKKKNTISFCFSKLDINQGQSVVEWEDLGLFSQFIARTQQIAAYEYDQALAKQLVKQYTKVGFPPKSEFIEPKHVSPQYWAVIHITPNSKEVVAGFLEDSVFYVVFLDKEHKFWPTTSIQDRGKVKR